MKFELKSLRRRIENRQALNEEPASEFALRSNIHGKVFRCAQRGFSLIEIMVALLIGLIGVLVVFSVLAAAEGRKRSTAAGTEAQTGGAIALMALSGDIKLGGYGFVGAEYIGDPIPADFFGCPVQIHLDGHVPADFTHPLVPVLIDQGASGAPDAITVWWGNSAIAAATQSFQAPTTAESKTVTEGRASFQLHDLVLVVSEQGSIAGGVGCPNAPNSAVALVEISGNSAPAAMQIDHASGADFPFNHAGGPNVPAAFSDGFLFNLGQAPHINQWSINTQPALQVQDVLRGTNPVMNGENVIDLQAQYGFDSAFKLGAAAVQPDIKWSDVQTGYEWSQLRAVRVAILVRSGNWERDEVTTAAPSWAGGAFNMSATVPADGTGWKHYRYRVYQTAVPLPNMIWGSGS